MSVSSLVSFELKIAWLGPRFFIAHCCISPQLLLLGGGRYTVLRERGALSLPRKQRRPGAMALN